MSTTNLEAAINRSYGAYRPREDREETSEIDPTPTLSRDELDKLSDELQNSLVYDDGDSWPEVKQFLAEGADPLYMSTYGTTTIVSCLTKYPSPDSLQVLVDHIIKSIQRKECTWQDIHRPDRDSGNTPLHMAVETYSNCKYAKMDALDCVDILLECHGDPMVVNDKGDTVLVHALKCGASDDIIMAIVKAVIMATVNDVMATVNADGDTVPEHGKERGQMGASVFVFRHRSRNKFLS